MALDPANAAACKLYRERHPERVAAARSKRCKTETQKTKVKEWRLRNPDRIKAIKQAHYARNKTAYRNANLIRKYGINLERFNQMLAEQKGVCAICLKPSARAYHVDHDHKTGNVRGILCHQCNTSLGWFEANRIGANQYLENYS